MMNEAVQKLRVELKKSGGGSLRPASEEGIDAAKLFGFPAVLLDFYRESAPDAKHGRIELAQRIWSVQNAIAENRDYVPGADLFPLGYVVFASNKFGDAYCIDTNRVDSYGDYSVVLFPHDVVEEGVSVEDVEQYRLAVATNLEDFLRKFAQRTVIEKPKYE